MVLISRSIKNQPAKIATQKKSQEAGALEATDPDLSQNKPSTFATFVPVASISLKDIINGEPKEAVAIAKGLFVNRRTPEHQSNTAFYEGDHWQKGNGWIGEKPSIAIEGLAGAAIGMEKIRQGFVPINVIAEVNDRHVGGVLGREVNFDFVSADLLRLRRKKAPELPDKDPVAQQTDEDLTGWWNEDRPKDKLKESLVIALNEERSLLRFFIPRGLRDKNQQIPKQPNIPSALNFLHVDVVYSDKGGVFVDTDTRLRFGLYVKQENDRTIAELSWVESGLTILKVLSDDPDLVTEPLVCDLGGRLWMYELQRKPLITESVRALNRSINLDNTMMMRNVNLAGSRERYFMNVQRPTETVRVPDPAQALGYREERRPLAGLPVGAGASVFLDGVLIRDKEKDGAVIDRADPNISVTEPVQVTTFVQTYDQLYAALLGQCQQAHYLMSKDATSSGRSREQARAEFEGSLRLSKELVDDAGRWMLETGLRLAAHLCGKSAAYASLRCDFNSIIETGPISTEERQANRDDMKAKVLSRESVMSRNGTEDVDAEKKRIADDEKEAPVPAIPPPPQPNGDSQLIQ